MIIVSLSVMAFVVCFSQLLSTYCKQNRPRSGYFLESRLIRVHIVCFNEKNWNALEFMQQIYKAGNIFRWKYFSTLLFINVFLSGIPYEYQYVWIQIMSDILLGHVWATSGSKLFAKCISRQQNLPCSQRVNVAIWSVLHKTFLVLIWMHYGVASNV